ncbi:ATP-binding protein [uncultured Megasphaera sp.]|uniref:ATP-binding protein n=1 Tax=uncultured Megasphaera sp. TaxID=165188 RepID=UPI00265A1E09|nr:4Fe-4S dicluster domain-containing protein [uncultured Megasphaera sp.]
MIRRIIHIDTDACNGCGACAAACHEGAIAIVEGKARLMRDDYCDGLGDCLPHCPTDAISFIEKDTVAYDEEAVKANMKAQGREYKKPVCPGSQARTVTPSAPTQSASSCPKKGPSQLRQWPVQIKLVPVKTEYFDGAHLLIAADCTAYAYASFHEDFMKNAITLIGCPKLDETDYAEKLTEIIRQNAIADVTVVRMEVPCCGGLELAAQKALAQSGKHLPWQVHVLTINGQVKEGSF